MPSFFHKYRLILLFAVIVLVVHLLFPDPRYWELHRDELLYLADGRHLAWGYMEIPPATAFLAWICHLTGDSFFIVKFFPALFGALTIFITGRIVIEMKGGIFAQLLACMAYLFSAYLRLNMLFQANSLEVLCFTAGAYCLIRYINTQQQKYILFTGLIIGLGMLNKYSMLLFAAGVLAGLLLTRHRRLFTKWSLYIGILLAFLVLLPNFLWQMAHDFPVAFHMRMLERQQLQYVSQRTFLINQLIMDLPGCFIWIAGLCYVFFNPEGKKYILLGWIYAAVIGALLLLHGKDYYAFGAYPMLMAAGGVFLEKLSAGKIPRYTLRPLFAIIPLFLAPGFIPLALPIFPPDKMIEVCARYKSLGLLRWEDGQDHALPQDYADMAGWKEMAGKVAAAYGKLDSAEKAHTLLFCDNYGEAGAVDYYGKKYHLPEAYSDNASFLYWLPEKMHIDNLLLVTDDEQEMHHPFIKQFKYAAVADSITTPYARERGTLIIIMKGASEVFNKDFRQKIAKDNARAQL